jgi:hypothetical protein
MQFHFKYSTGEEREDVCVGEDVGDKVICGVGHVVSRWVEWEVDIKKVRVNQ